MKDVRLTRDYDAQRERQNMRVSNAERLRRRRKKNRTLHYILLLILTIVIGITLSVTVFFNIDTINVEGNQRYTQQEIADFSGIGVGKNMFRINVDNIEQTILKAATDIDNVVVNRTLPATLNISIEESKPTAVAFYENAYYTISGAGRVIDITSEKPQAEVILLHGIKLQDVALGGFIKNVEDKDSYVNFDNLTSAIDKSEIQGITVIDISNEFAVSVYWENRVQIILGNMNDLDYKFDFASEILSSKVAEGETGVLDVSKPGKGYYRIKEIQLPNAQESLPE